MTLTKEMLLKALDIVKRLQEASVKDADAIHALKAEANQFKSSHEVVSDPEIVAAFDALIKNAAVTPSPGESGVVPQEDVIAPEGGEVAPVVDNGVQVVDGQVVGQTQGVPAQEQAAMNQQATEASKEESRVAAKSKTTTPPNPTKAQSTGTTVGNAQAVTAAQAGVATGTGTAGTAGTAGAAGA